jgi:hypothetical protein
VNISLPHQAQSWRGRAPSPRIVWSASFAAAALCAVTAFGAAGATDSPSSALPLGGQSPRPHAAGDVLGYSLHGTLSQTIVGHDPFGRSVHQTATATDLQGRERVAVKSVSAKGLSLHRSGSILATFKGKSSLAQSGTGWTLVTPVGDVEDRKGSTLGGLFLLPLSFLGDHAINGGAFPSIGDSWDEKLGMALFGMAAQPRLHYKVIGTRQVFGITVFTLSASGSAPVKEPIVTNDGIALGIATGLAHVTLRCDYDPLSLQAVSMDIDITGNLRIQTTHHGAAGSVRDHQHYLVALDAQSIQAGRSAVDPPKPKSGVTSPQPRQL